MDNLNIGIEVTGPYKKVNAATKAAIRAKDIAQSGLDEAFDAAVNFGWELGAVDKQGEILEIVDALIEKLDDSEEDAKMALDILKKAVLESSREDGDIDGRVQLHE